MIEIIKKSDCCGCEACVQKCPKQCISFKMDKEGFYYPEVEVEHCIDCGICEKVCPVLNQGNPTFPLHIYAVRNPNESVRMHSSSGGFFSMLADKMLSEDGLVYAARFNDSFEVFHSLLDNVDGMNLFRGSKYVQSRIGNCFKEVQKELVSGRKVFFTGTPCQVSALRLFLRKEYDDLFTAEVVCHGVPSPGVWLEYLEELKRNKNIHQIKDVCFRNKETGWKHYSFSVEYLKNGKTQRFSEYYTQNVYMKGFTQNFFLRPSCFQCPCKSNKSGADLTMGDFWGVQTYRPDLDDDKGTSFVFLNTKKAVNLAAMLHAEFTEIDYNEVVKGNPSIVSSSVSPEKREYFFLNRKKKTITKLMNNLTRPPFILNLKLSMYYFLKKVLK